MRAGRRAALLLCTLLAALGAHAASASAAQTIVSLTFDDGDATQYQVRAMLSSHQMNGTFYLNGARIGTDDYYMTWPQIADLYADGNEIGGHTAYHPDLTTLSTTEATREVCYDRDIVLGHGYPVTDFAYPYGSYNATLESIVQGCGYNSARSTDAFDTTCFTDQEICSEPIPPANAYAIRTAEDDVTTTAQLENEVMNAEKSGGGWLPFLFHTVCTSDCSVTPASLSAFMDWLQPRAATGTVVRTVKQVIGGPVAPAVPGPPLPPAPNGTNAIHNPSLETDADGDKIPDCFSEDWYGTQTVAWARVSPGHTGTYALKTTVTHHSDGDAKLDMTQDLGDCMPTVIPGHKYKLSVWYKASVATSFSLITRDTNFAQAYWTSSPNFPASASTWAQATFTTPVIPAGINGLAFGLAIEGNGNVTVDDFGFDDAAPSTGDTTPPTSTIACNAAACANSFYGAPVSVTLAASDNSGGSGVAQIRYTTDGSDPTATTGTVYAGAFSLPATTTVKYRAFDNAGNAEAVHTQVVNIDTTAPASTIKCNGGSCAGSFNPGVSVTLSATDGGSGVAQIRYTTDGTTPTATTGTVYGAAFTVSVTTTVKYRAFDVAGNAEAVNSQSINILTGAPTSTISCNGGACASTYYGAAVSVTLAATDAGGPGVGSIRYTTDGSDPTATTGYLYGGAFNVIATTTVKYRAFDTAGNAEAVNAQAIKVDLLAPTSTIACNASACASGYYAAPVSVSLAASDADSGVAQIRYTTDGSTPTASTGNVYSGPFSLASTTTVKYRAFDVAGNAEAVNTQLVNVDGSAPSVTVSAPVAGATVSGTSVALTASASDNIAVDHVDLRVDGTVVGTATSAPYTVTWNSTTVADGSHSITARAVDGVGNATISSAVTVTVANNPNLFQNPSLESATGSTPTCWLLGGYGNNTVAWARTSDAHTGSFAETLTVSAYTDGDRKLVSAQDTGTCAPPAAGGQKFTASAWYKSAAQPIIFAFYRNSSGAWVYWAQSPKQAASTTWAQATWSTPALPAGATAVSIGMGLSGAGAVTMDDFGLVRVS